MNETTTTTEPTSVWNPTEAGAKRTLGFTPASPIRPAAKPASPTARTDKKPADYLTRLLRAIKVPESDRSRLEPFLGAQIGVGWKMATTDGSRAVLVAGTDGKPYTGGRSGFLAQRATTTVTLTPPFHLALKRMAAASHTPTKDRPAAVIVRLHPESDTVGELELAVRNIDDGVDASERVAITGTALRRARVRLNIRYIDDALGRWPLTVRIAGEGDAVSFENDVCTYVLMPLSGGDPLPGEVDPVVWEPWIELLHGTPAAETPVKRPKRTKKTAAEPVVDPAEHGGWNRTDRTDRNPGARSSRSTPRRSPSWSTPTAPTASARTSR